MYTYYIHLALILATVLNRQYEELHVFVFHSTTLKLYR